MSPDGEGGKWKSVGGLVRDRPLTKPPISGDWELRNARQDVDDAIRAGIDGFHVDLFQASGDGLKWHTYQNLLRAADERGFRIMPCLDMNGFGEPGNRDLGMIVDVVREMHGRLSNVEFEGKVVVSAYGANGESPDWWASCLARLKAEGLPVVLWPTILGGPNARTWLNAMERRGLCIGVMGWDATYEPKGLRATTAFPQIDVPRIRRTVESRGAERYISEWTAAIRGKPGAVLVATWNDHAEGTQIRPCVGSGRAWCVLTAYLSAWYKTGRPPAVPTERVLWFQRVASVKGMDALGWGGERDPVDVLSVATILSAPATVSVYDGAGTPIGSQTVGEGLSNFTVPIRLGKSRIVMTRGGRTLYDGTTIPLAPVAPARPDYLYRAAVGDL